MLDPPPQEQQQPPLWLKTLGKHFDLLKEGTGRSGPCSHRTGAWPPLPSCHTARRVSGSSVAKYSTASRRRRRRWCSRHTGSGANTSATPAAARSPLSRPEEWELDGSFICVEWIAAASETLAKSLKSVCHGKSFYLHNEQFSSGHSPNTQVIIRPMLNSNRVGVRLVRRPLGTPRHVLVGVRPAVPPAPGAERARAPAADEGAAAVEVQEHLVAPRAVQVAGGGEGARQMARKRK